MTKPGQRTITVTLRLPDTRPAQRSIRRIEAQISDLAQPRTAQALTQVLDPSSIVRKALGEFD